MRISELPFKIGDKVSTLDTKGNFAAFGEVRDIDLFALPDGLNIRYVVFKLNGEYAGLFVASRLELLELTENKEKPA